MANNYGSEEVPGLPQLFVLRGRTLHPKASYGKSRGRPPLRRGHRRSSAISRGNLEALSSQSV